MSSRKQKCAYEIVVVIRDADISTSSPGAKKICSAKSLSSFEKKNPVRFESEMRSGERTFEPPDIRKNFIFISTTEREICRGGADSFFPYFISI